MGPPELNQDVTEEILLRIPPDEPEHLIRASAVCRLWLRVASDAAFLRRYRAFHGGAPLLGFFHSIATLQPFPGFIPTTAASSPPQPPVGDGSARRALDCRHGRVLLSNIWTGNFVVWDPLSNHWDELQSPWVEPPAPWFQYNSSPSNAVVLCAMADCNHISCRGGPFRVICAGMYPDCEHYDWESQTTLLAHIYSSESRTWCTTAASSQLDGVKSFDTERAALIGDGVYFSVNHGTRIVKYDLVEHRFSTIRVPPYLYGHVILMQYEDGSLGIAGVSGSRLYLWSTMVDAEGDRRWIQRRVIKLEEILPADIAYVHANVIGFAEAVEVFLISTNFGAFTFELKSGRVRKVGTASKYHGVTPFIGFFTPDRACSKWTKESLPHPDEEW